MNYDPLGNFQPTTGQRLWAGALTIVTAAIGLVEWILFRSIVLRFLALSQASIWSWRWWDLASAILYALLWLLLVYSSGHYYHKSLEAGRLWCVFGAFTAGQVLVPGLLLGSLQIVAWSTG